MAERMRRRAERRFRSLVDGADEGIWLIGAGDGIVYANGWTERVLGYSPERLREVQSFDLVHPQDRSVATSLLTEVRALPGVVRSGEVRCRAADGAWRWLEVTVTNRLQDRDVRAVVAHLRDVTDSVRAEEGLRAAEAKYRMLFELNPRPMWVFDVQTLRYLDVNRAAVEHYGYSREEFLSMTLPDIRPQEDVAPMLADLELHEGGPRGLWRHLTKSGREITAEIYTHDLDFDGRPARVVLAVDVTERLRIEASVRESEERFRALFAHAPVGQTLASLDGRFVQVNPAYCEMTGLSEPDLLGMGWRDLFPLEDDAGEERLVRDLIEGRIPVYQLERPYTQPDGRRSVHLVTVSLVRGADGEPRFTEGLVLDITDRKKAEEAVHRAAERQTALAGLSRRSLTGADIPSLIEEALRTLESTIDVPLTALADISVDDAMMLRAGHGWRSEVIGLTSRLGLSTVASATLAAGEPVTVEDYEAHPRFTLHPVLAEEGVRASAMTVVGPPAAPRGILAVHSPEPRVWDEDEIGFLQAVADLLAQAMDRAESQQELQRNIDALRATDRERRSLMSRLVSVQEEERSRIAGDIHDDSVQVMTALGMQLHAFGKRLTSEEDLAALARAGDVVRMTIQRLRHLMFDLRPPALDRVGLAAALRDYLENMHSETGVEYRLENLLATEPTTEAATVMYRIAQEALNNARKHASARRIDVLLQDRSGGVFVRIHDDGRGFRSNRILGVAHGHLGLTSMRERAELTGGWCKVRSAMDRGTTVQCWIPSDVGRPCSVGEVPA